jgi:hypothetical protein
VLTNGAQCALDVADMHEVEHCAMGCVYNLTVGRARFFDDRVQGSVPFRGVAGAHARKGPPIRSSGVLRGACAHGGKQNLACSVSRLEPGRV